MYVYIYLIIINTYLRTFEGTVPSKVNITFVFPSEVPSFVRTKVSIRTFVLFYYIRDLHG